MSKREAYHSHQSSVANPLSNRSLLISYKKRLINTYIINTTLVAPYYSMFQPLKGHLQGVRLIVVYMQHMVPSLSIRVPGGLSIRS